jgi:hypothetical protein
MLPARCEKIEEIIGNKQSLPCIMEPQIMQGAILTVRCFTRLRHAVLRLVRERRAQDLAEYGISLAVIGAGAATAAIAIRGNVAELWVTHARLLQKIASLAGS